jgi:LCP family protein required for cell wall assembly
VKRKTNYKKIVSNIFVIILLIAFVFSTLIFIKEWEKKRGIYTGDRTTQTDIEYEGRFYKQKDNVQAILVMGLDKFSEDITVGSYNNDQQADFLALIVIDRDNMSYDIVHINRDTMTEVTMLGVGGQALGTEVKQIALSHSYGSGGKDSCRNTVTAVSEFLGGITIDNYVSLTMDAVAILNDAVGGVTVTVTDDFSGIDDTLIKGKEVTLYGEHALNYVRTRYGMEDSTNVARMARQREYLMSLWESIEKSISEDEDFIMNTSLEIADHMVTDCTTAQLERIYETVNTYQTTEIRTIEGESVKGDNFMEFYADEDALQRLVLDLFYEAK